MTLVLLSIVAMIIGFAAIVDEAQFHRPGRCVYNDRRGVRRFNNRNYSWRYT